MINYNLEGIERLIGKDTVFEFVCCASGEVMFKNLPLQEYDYELMFYLNETIDFFKHQKLEDLLKLHVCEITADNETIYFKKYE